EQPSGRRLQNATKFGEEAIEPLGQYVLNRFEANDEIERTVGIRQRVACQRQRASPLRATGEALIDCGNRLTREVDALCGDTCCQQMFDQVAWAAPVVEDSALQARRPAKELDDAASDQPAEVDSLDGINADRRVPEPRNLLVGPRHWVRRRR